MIYYRFTVQTKIVHVLLQLQNVRNDKTNFFTQQGLISAIKTAKKTVAFIPQIYKKIIKCPRGSKYIYVQYLKQ